MEPRNISEWLVNTRRQIHMKPELAYQEKITTELVKSILEDLNIETRTFDDVTGVVGLIKNKEGGRTIGLRADMDALPLDELTDVEHKSRNQGIMHACGHDANTTIMLGVAKWLVESGKAKELNGNVKFIFQPAEEGGQGARKLINRGVLENPKVDWILAGHLFPDVDYGKIGIAKTKSHASTDTFIALMKGKGGHGARPHQCVDPVVATGAFIQAVQTVVSRSIDPLEAGVITIGAINGGRTFNVIPQEVEIKGTIRALTHEVRKTLLKRLQEIAKGISETYGLNCELTLRTGNPPVINDAEVSTFMHETAAQVVGEENVLWLPPTTGGEDFAFYAEQIPGTIIRLGSRNQDKGIVYPLHSPYFDIDERVLALGVDIFAKAVVKLLS
ncbi:M20 metallopeptidase family protein [Dethiosulfatarculus sandiegensis]|uniref:M20 metallopeptidase family protein n=1 Tax=Dethiosulfatarculus sandiegensis TaxID=1429043 RepID=UPI0005C9729C|nr:M20 family metallopeptidase [Dethiosulfatarculus sandiegensis]